MKRVVPVLAVLALVIPMTAAAQTVLVNDAFATMGSWQAAYGQWKVNEGALEQIDSRSLMAKANRPTAQNGTIQYEFDVKYLDGGFASEQDFRNGVYHGGFGIHISVDKPHAGRSWGNGKSYLLWLNLDTRPDTKARFPQHYGFRAQVYRSDSNSRMTLLSDYNIPIPMDRLTRSFLESTIPIRIVVNTETGLVKVYDPTVPNYVYRFRLDGDLSGSYVSFRTNSIAARFDSFKVTKIR